MPDYIPPLDDMKFLLGQVTRLSDLQRADLDDATIDAVLSEAAKLASDVLSPLNQSGDTQGAKLNGDSVTTSPGFKDAYHQYRDSGWNSVPFDPAFGGQGLPWLLSFPVQEMWQSANMAFGLCPLLNQGAVDAIHTHGTAEQKDEYLAKLISGEWTGTMNLTEPQAGSDLALLRSKAIANGDGTYKISGQKIFITYGEHDMADNIIHLVLARLPDAPEGTRGISLFLVPKFLKDGTRNDVKCIGLEHKLGIHGSPTCTMAFGDNGGASGTLLGQENEGLKCMFTMMNNARLSVGLQGVAIAERAYQAAYHYAHDRKQGKSFAGGDTAVIAAHPDVKRMLLSMKSQIAAGRALAYQAAYYLDKAKTGDATAQAFVDLLTPVVKSWCTDMSVEVASTSVQVHGGMGFIEETGVAQFYRDARILPIYEGTNGIQANDLLFRKIFRDKGAALFTWIDANKSGHADILHALKTLRQTSELLLKHATNPDAAAFVASPYLRLFGLVAGADLLQQSADISDDRKEVSRFFSDTYLPQATALAETIRRQLA